MQENSDQNNSEYEHVFTQCMYLVIFRFSVTDQLLKINHNIWNDDSSVREKFPYIKFSGYISFPELSNIEMKLCWNIKWNV